MHTHAGAALIPSTPTPPPPPSPVWLAVVIYVLSAWTLARLSSVALEREASAKSPHSTRHNGTKKRCGCFTRATSKMRADVIGGMRLLSVAMLSRVAIVLLCTVAIVCSSTCAVFAAP